MGHSQVKSVPPNQGASFDEFWDTIEQWQYIAILNKPVLTKRYGEISMKNPDIRQIDILYHLLPNEEYRRVCLSLFVESSQLYLWERQVGAYCYSEGVRLLVGSLIIFTVHKEGLWLSPVNNSSR